MKKNLKPNTALLTHPVFIVGSYDVDEKPDISTVSWGGVCCSEPPCIAISLRKATLSYHNIIHSKAFTVSIPSETQVVQADFVGLVSGRTYDKFTNCQWHSYKSQFVLAPCIEEMPLTFECKLIYVNDLGLHTQFIGEVINVSADETILNDRELPDISKVKPFIFGSHGNRQYYGIGEALGKSFSIGKSLIEES